MQAQRSSVFTPKRRFGHLMMFCLLLSELAAAQKPSSPSPFLFSHDGDRPWYRCPCDLANRSLITS
jgi:hypothetical protein